MSPESGKPPHSPPPSASEWTTCSRPSCKARKCLHDPVGLRCPLGHHSILADPRTVESKGRLDREIKRRERFRPYAPSVLAQHANDHFELLGPSPYMLVAVDTRPLGRARVPGIVHADGSARVQTVDREVEPTYYRLITRFHEIAGVPPALNTSFNGYGEPMVESPRDAVRSMHAMGLDALAIGDYLAWPEDRPA
jgi:carbamoyltransferase